MRISFCLIYFCIVLFACKENHKQENEHKVYVISKQDSIYKAQWKAAKLPPPPLLYYGHYNFIVDNSGNYFVHRKSYGLRYCGTDIDGSKPDFIRLKPSDITLIDSQFINRFLKDSIPNMDHRKQIVIASFDNTLNAEPFIPLIKILTKDQKFLRCNIRRVTEEEKVVLNYKLSHKVYSPDSIKWSRNFSNVFEVPGFR